MTVQELGRHGVEKEKVDAALQIVFGKYSEGLKLDDQDGEDNPEDVDLSDVITGESGACLNNCLWLTAQAAGKTMDPSPLLSIACATVQFEACLETTSRRFRCILDESQYRLHLEQAYVAYPCRFSLLIKARNSPHFVCGRSSKGHPFPAPLVLNGMYTFTHI